MKMEVRGETGEINQYMYDSAVQVIKGCALSQGCEYKIEKMGEAVDLTNDPELVDVLREAGKAVEGLNVREDPMNLAAVKTPPFLRAAFRRTAERRRSLCLALTARPGTTPRALISTKKRLTRALRSGRMLFRLF